MNKDVYIAVVGPSAATPAEHNLGEEVGRLIAESGAVLVCGGNEGVMESASRGAAEAGGEVIGIVPGLSVEEANRHCTHVVASGIGHGRNLSVVGSGLAVIAVGGEWGTLSEIGFARAIGRTVVALRSWELTGREQMEGAPGVLGADTPAEAVELALRAL